MWGDQPLPLVIVVDSGSAVGSRSATVRSEATGAPMRAAWKHSGGDSVRITLERVGVAGTIALGPDVGGRAGTASSGAIGVEDGGASRAKRCRHRRACESGEARARGPRGERCPTGDIAPDRLPDPLSLRR